MEYKDPGRYIPIIYLPYSWGSLFGVPSRVPLIFGFKFDVDDPGGEADEESTEEIRLDARAGNYTFSYRGYIGIIGYILGLCSGIREKWKQERQLFFLIHLERV